MRFTRRVTFLEQTKDTAVQARNDFARNLSNIAHQIKTPITAMSLSVQMMAGVCAEDQGLCGGRQQKVYEKEKRYLEQNAETAFASDTFGGGTACPVPNRRRNIALAAKKRWMCIRCWF